MVDHNALPIGIRNHNPGNLRSACWLRSKTHLVSGYAAFSDDTEGLINLAACVGQFYYGHKLNTVASFISRYAPASENDLLHYERFIAKWLGYTQAEIGSRDMELFSIPNVAHLMLGIIRMECGVPRPALLRGPEWFTLADAMRAVNACGWWEGR